MRIRLHSTTKKLWSRQFYLYKIHCIYIYTSRVRMVLVCTYVCGCTNARNLSETQPTATAPCKLSKMNHSTERTCQPPALHDFKVEIIDLSLSQNENELVQEPTPVEETTLTKLCRNPRRLRKRSTRVVMTEHQTVVL